METIESTPTQYALGHSEPELERLSRQAQAFEPFTRHFLQQAGVGAGMRVLDVGCGSGDVAFLAAELVGASGEVVGADRAATAVQWASSCARSRGIKNVSFIEGDLAALQFDRPFDAVVGRLVLMYCPNSVETIRRLAKHVHDEGLVAFQEISLAESMSTPPAPTYERATNWIKQTLLATGASLQLGLELHRVFLEAGLPGPWMRMDTMIGGGPECPAYELIADIVQSLLPVMEELQIATAAEVGISNLAQRMRYEVVSGKGVALSPHLIGAWSRKPAALESSGRAFDA